MMTTNVIQRTFFLKVPNGYGTCFAVDVEGRQYFITAKHVARGLRESDTVQVFHESQWKELGVRLAGLTEDPVDVAVLVPSYKLIWGSKLEPSSTGMVFGQDVYFLGFPYGLRCEVGDLNRGFPVPFVKKAILSAFGNKDTGEFYLDGHNNPGFSGGPVVFERPGKIRPQISGQIVALEYQVAGVVSAYRFHPEPIYKGETDTSLRYRANTGIVMCYNINKALEIIRSNPIGLSLEDEIQV